MKKFLLNIFIFTFLSLILGEVIVRANRLNQEVPQRTVDNNGIQKFIPNQKGYWATGEHSWQVNKLGWSGELPQNYDNLVSIIGDSYIANFMNPVECHQNIFLKKQLPEYNFVEAGRPGVTFIEAVEISQNLTPLKPNYHIIYARNNDFIESIQEVRNYSDRTQISLERAKIIPGQLKYAQAKKILYNWKLAFYFFNRLATPAAENKESEINSKAQKKFKHLAKVEKLLELTSDRYDISNIILTLHPDTAPAIVKKAQEVGFKTILLEKKEENWSFEHDNHWTCYGHERVSVQVGTGFKKAFNSVN
ncbi:hypothetical protein I4641_13595 [Waterburya agarophytonicola K14]|uniref:SGNH/GDSL hydrolase family protein n=1 Tax=Waterburya agarophytonicola KI4 TaxID=2874699 RepID=A0A964BT19_9CYAN|nr:hypothetical protein [Waterburya agarophytonicola]MCC0178013.1 hypothetical protein [Waterburya agarophytonicola KI4]